MLMVFACMIYGSMVGHNYVLLKAMLWLLTLFLFYWGGGGGGGGTGINMAILK